MQKKLLISTVLALAFSTLPMLGAKATKVDDAIWVDGVTYGVVLTDTAFTSPPPQSTDNIYSFMDSGLDGQRSVSAAAPGDPDYNGGRWHVFMVVFTDEGMAVHDPDGDGHVNFELQSEEAVLMHADLGHLMIVDTGVYFECPLIPSRGR